MTVKRIVRNVAVADPNAAKAFYGDILQLNTAMDMGWIMTFASDGQAAAQISFMSEGGSGTPVPDISIEVDDFGAVLDRLESAGIDIEYGPVVEPWGVRRCYVRDPFGQLVNILTHE